MASTIPHPLYEISGALCKGFQGHIAYTTVLPQQLAGLEICVTFDKREPEQEPLLRAACAAAIRQNEPGLELTEQQQSFLSRSPKSEINVSVFLNGQCVGSAHRNQLTKRIVLAPDAACEGFVACRPEGVLHVLNVLNDDMKTLQQLAFIAHRAPEIVVHFPQPVCGQAAILNGIGRTENAAPGGRKTDSDGVHKGSLLYSGMHKKFSVLWKFL